MKTLIAVMLITLLTVGCASQTAQPTPEGSRGEQTVEDDGFPWLWVIGGAVVVAAGLAVAAGYLAAKGASEAAAAAAGPDESPCCSFPTIGDGS